MWHITKSRGRVSLPISERNSDAKVKAGLHKELISICGSHRQLQNTLLNSMRFCYAVMKAVVYGERVMYKEKQVLFLELLQAFHDYGCKLLQ